MLEKINTLLKRPHIQDALAATVGILIAALSWHANHPPISALVLPLVVGLAASRRHAFLIALGYTLAVGRAGGGSSWSDSVGTLSSILIWIAASLLGGLGWMLAWTRSDLPWRKASAQAMAWAVTLLLPIAVPTMGHVLPAYGYLLQGWHWFGVTVSVALPVVCSFLCTKERLPLWQQRTIVALAFLVLWLGSLGTNPIETRFLDDMVAPSTQWGSVDNEAANMDHLKGLGKLTRRFSESQGSIVIWPQGVLQTLSPHLLKQIDTHVLKDALASRQTVVLGTHVALAEGGFLNVALVFHPDGPMETVTERQAVPLIISFVIPAKASYKPDWSRNPVMELGGGRKARMVFGYEEFIPLMALFDEATQDFQLTVVMSSSQTYMSKTETSIQRHHSLGMATLFRGKYLRTANLPRRSSPNSKV